MFGKALCWAMTSPKSLARQASHAACLPKRLRSRRIFPPPSAHGLDSLSLGGEGYRRRSAGTSNVTSSKRSVTMVSRLGKHVAEERALFDRIVECDVSVRIVIEPTLGHIAFSRVSIAGAQHGHREGLDVQRRMRE